MSTKLLHPITSWELDDRRYAQMNPDRITITKVNSYTTICNIDGRNIKLVDRGIKKAHKDHLILQLKQIIGTIGFIFFGLFLIGIVGHSDYCVEANIVDTWSYATYIQYIILGCAGLIASGITIRNTEM